MWWKLIVLAGVVVLVSGCFGQEQSRGTDFSCRSDSDCVMKGSQCGYGCYHIDQEPEIIDSDVVCKFRPLFRRERCECVNNKCTHITCEDQGLNYTECDS